MIELSQAANDEAPTHLMLDLELREPPLPPPPPAKRLLSEDVSPNVGWVYLLIFALFFWI